MYEVIATASLAYGIVEVNKFAMDKRQNNNKAELNLVNIFVINDSLTNKYYARYMVRVW